MKRSLVAILGVLLCLPACGDDGPPPGVSDGGERIDAPSADVTLSLDGSISDAGTTGDGCLPTCEAPCASDGCGGLCGGCEGVCDGTMCIDVAGDCPPAGPFGTSVEDVAADAMLEDCEGNPVSLHSLCGQRASWLYRFSEWCPPCQSFARTEAADLFSSYEEQGVSAVLVIAQNRDYTIATRADCARIRDELGLPFQVLIDPRNELSDALGIRVNAEAVVFDSAMRIQYSEQYDHSGIASTVNRVLIGTL